MASKVFLILPLLMGNAWAGCRYTNPEWDLTSTTAPSIQAAVTNSQGLVVQVKWNQSLIIQYPQCVDVIQVFASASPASLLLCSAKIQGSDSCESHELSCDSLKDTHTDFWLTLINEDHKDGIQHVRAPQVTRIENLCQSEPVVKIQDSESCEAIVPQWINEPQVEYLRGRRGLRYVTLKWSNSHIDNPQCLSEFEVKYWPRGKASQSFVTSAISANKEHYSAMLEVDECEEYTYILRASKNNPSLVVNHQATFMSLCKNGIIKSQKLTTRKTTTTTTTTPPTTTTTTTTTTESSTTTSELETTTVSSSTTTTMSTSTETTRLTSMLFNPQDQLEEVTTELESNEKLEDMLFKEEVTTKATPRLPKTSQSEFEEEESVMTSKIIETELNTTEQQEKDFEYVESDVEEDTKYLENAIGIDQHDEDYQHHEGATDFDELLAKTQESSNGKNARSLQLDGYNNALKLNPSHINLMMLILAFYLL